MQGIEMVIGYDTSLGHENAAATYKIFFAISPERKLLKTRPLTDTKEEAFYDQSPLSRGKNQGA